MDTTPERPRRLHDARICPDCLQEFPGGRGYQGHDCPGRPQRTAAESEANPLDRPGPWDDDVTAILVSAGFADGGVSWKGPIRRMMAEAWRYGYTTGMADAAKIEEAVGEPGNEIGHHRFAAAQELGLTWNPMKQTFE